MCEFKSQIICETGCSNLSVHTDGQSHFFLELFFHAICVLCHLAGLATA